jgi:UDP-N-acetylmuramate--alanine ligase
VSTMPPCSARWRGFQGIDRRLQFSATVAWHVAAAVTIVDDYGHHPTEIAATLAAAPGVAGRRLVLAFQPHRYTRTRDLLDDFARVLSAPTRCS